MEPSKCPYHSTSAEMCVVQKSGTSLILFFKQCMKWDIMETIRKKSMSLEAQGGDVQVGVNGRLAMWECRYY